jgi:hypothetical protein
MKSKQLVILLQLLLFIMSLLTTSWLWDRWMLDGPHGSYRWIGMDFASYWVGVRGMIDGIDPYNPETTLEIQQVLYGGPALAEDPMLFSYPAWLFLPIVPLALLPYQWATILWVGLLLSAILNLLFKLAPQLGNKNILAQSLWLVGLVIGSLPFLIISVMKGQLGCLSLLALFAAYQIKEHKPLPAGMLLGFALIKPTVTVIPVAVFILWALTVKNWKLLSGFAACMTILIGTSFLAVGNWVPSYFEMLDAKVATTILWSMEFLRVPWNFFYAALFLGTLVLSIYLSWKRNRSFWFPASILAGIALTPMRWIYDLFLAILVLVERRSFSPLLSWVTGAAVLSPWLLVLVPDPHRWKIAVLGLPLVWAAVVLSQMLGEDRRIDPRPPALPHARE